MTDISKNNEYCLIKGEFDPDEARRVLMTLINDKINFHQVNELSHQERYGESNPSTAKRIEELSQTRDAIDQLVEVARAQGYKLKISSQIEVELTAG